MKPRLVCEEGEGSAMDDERKQDIGREGKGGKRRVGVKLRGTRVRKGRKSA